MIQKVSKQTNTRRVPKSLYLVLSGLILLMMSVAAYADTYNFFFDKKKKGSEQAESEEGESSPAPDAAPVAPLAAPVVPQSSQQTISTPSGQPLIINNTVSVPNTTSVPTTNTSPGPYQQSGAPVLQAEIPAVAPVAKARPTWRLGVSTVGTILSGKKGLSDSSDFDWEPNGSQSGGYLLSLGYRFEPSIGVNVYAGRVTTGAALSSHVVGGADFEWMALRRNAGDWDAVELGLLAGFSNFTGKMDRLEAMHVGARLNLNAGPHFSLSLAGKKGMNLAFAEVGISVNL